MKNLFKGALSLLLAFAICSGSSYIGLERLDFYKHFSIKANAAILELPVDGSEPTVQLCATPSITAVKNVENGVSISWGIVVGASSFRIYRKLSGGSYEKLADVGGSCGSYIDETVESGCKYYYAIKAGNEAGFTEKSASKGITFLSAPIVTGTKNTADGVKISWEAVKGATEYRVYVYNGGAFVYNGKTTGLSYTDKKVENGNLYYIVKAVNGSSISVASPYEQVYRSERPVIAKVENVSDGVLLRWNCSDSAENFNVYRKTSGGSYEFIGEVVSVSGSVVAKDTNVKPGTKYYYTIEAESNVPMIYIVGYTRGGFNCLSARAEPKAIVRLTTPVISGVKNTLNGVKISWGKVAGASEYKIYRGMGDSYKYLGKTTSLSFLDESAPCGEINKYSVKAVKSSFASSSGLSGLNLYLKRPEIKKVVGISGGLKVSWGKIEGASGYNVYRKISGGSYEFIGSVSSNSFIDYSAASGKYNYYKVEAGSDKKNQIVEFIGPSSSEYVHNLSATKSSAMSVNVGYGFSDLSPKSEAVSAFYLAAPVIKSTALSADSVTIKWSKVAAAKEYKVYRKVSGGSYKYLGKTTDLSFVDKTVKGGTKYYYVVKSVKGEHSSVKSDNAVVTFVEKPVISSATSKSEGILLKWGEIKGANGYFVYRKASSGEWKLLSVVKGGSKIKYLDETPRKGATYYYRVQASSSNSKSVNSSAFKIKCKY